MSKVVHFEITADDPARAVKFYESVFDWKIAKLPGEYPYWLASTGPDSLPGINGAIAQRNDPGARIYNIVDVPSVDEAVKKIEGAGGRIILPKGPVAGIGWVAYFTDTEGNVLGVIENDPNAK